MKMKKNYITPQIAVFTCNSESPLLGLSGGEAQSNVGDINLSDLSGDKVEIETGGKDELNSKFSSGMSWDEEE